ncbi:hypothetical protein BH24ACT22_BH24ACT22_18860 [soil metagenome]
MYRRRRIGAAIAIGLLLLGLAVWAGALSFLTGGAETDGATGRGTIENLHLSKSESGLRTYENSKVADPATEENGETADQQADADVSSGTEPQSKVVSKDVVATKPVAATPTETAQGKVEESANAEPLNVLILGVDQRPEDSSVEGSRSDTVMVARITPGTGSVKMLSLPRDLFVEIESGVEDRINAAYSFGGVEQITGVVEKATNISIDRYAVVDFEGFKETVDAVGGLTVEIQDEMPPGRHMEGTQTLNGEQALFYARYRGTTGGDLDRIKRQQQLVGVLREKLISWGTVSKLPGIMEAVHGNLETDLGLMANISLARSLLNAEDASSFETFQLAGVPTTLPDGRQVLVPDSVENEPILQEFRGEQSPSS